jgi:hypothetical protein
MGVPAVALTGTDTEPIRSADLFGWAIKMVDEDGKTVRVLVSDEALQDLESPPDYSIDRLNAYRSLIEEIASEKHTDGQQDPDGTVRVTSADVR